MQLERSSIKDNVVIAKSKQVLCCSFWAQSVGEGRMDGRNRDASKQGNKQNSKFEALSLLGLVNLFPRILKELRW